MKTVETFLKAKSDKNLSGFVLLQINGEKFMRLAIRQRIKYTNAEETIFVECPTDIFTDNLSHGRKVVTAISFHFFVYSKSHIHTFLKSIKKDSDVSFKVIAYNSCDVWNDCHLVNHKLYAHVDNSIFFLGEYTGRDNSASPVREYL